MSAKKWCTMGIVAILIIPLLVGILNFKVDPFGVFGDDLYSFNMTNNPRVAKIGYLKDNHEKYDSFIVGCSSSSSIPVKKLNEYTGSSFYNMIWYGADMLDTEQTVYYLYENYGVKDLIINIYISNGNEYDAEINNMTMSMHADVDKSSKLLFYLKYLFANPKYALSKRENVKKDRYLAEGYDRFNIEEGCYDMRKRDAEKVSTLEGFYESYPVFKNYPSWEQHLPNYEKCAESLKRIDAFCKEKGINVLYVNSPVYHDRFDDFPKEEILAYYTEMAKYVDFWDFSVTEISYDPRFFYDDTHYRNDVGEMLLARIYGDDSIYVPENFGFLVTKENAEEYVDSLYKVSNNIKNYTRRLPILLYHNIGEGKDESWVSYESFKNQMAKLKSEGYEAVSSSDVTTYIEKGEELPEKPILITFDNPNEKGLIYAGETLKEFGFSGILFSENGKTYESMDESVFEKALFAEIKKDDTLYNMEGDLIFIEKVKDVYNTYCQNEGEEPTLFAFPGERGDLLVQAIMTECKIKLTFSENPKVDTLIKGVSLSGNSLGRITVTSDMSPEDVLNLIR